MKRFINSCWAVCIAAALAGGCTNQEPALSVSAQPQPAENVAVPLAQQPPKTTVPPAATAIATVPEKAPPPAVSKAPVQTEQEMINRFKQWDQKLLSLKTNFIQTTEYDGIQVSRSQGVLFYDKNHQLLRLDTRDPDGTLTQSAITNKKEILILDESGKPVTTLSWEAWQQGQPNQALFDFGNYTALLGRHHVKRVQPNQLALTPKEGEAYTLYVTLSEKDFFPTELTLTSDVLVTRAQLQQTQKNNPLDLTIFGGFIK